MIYDMSSHVTFPCQRAMPPGMLQQLQRAVRGGGGMQEMMKAMMQGQGGDQADMEEMQRTFISLFVQIRIHFSDVVYHLCRHDAADGRNGRSWRARWRNAEHG